MTAIRYIVGSTRFSIAITTDEGSEEPGTCDAVLYAQVFGAKGGSNEVPLTQNDEFQQPFLPGRTDTFSVKFHSAVADPLAVRLVYRCNLIRFAAVTCYVFEDVFDVDQCSRHLLLNDLICRRPKDVAASAPPNRRWSLSAVNIKPNGSSRCCRT